MSVTVEVNGLSLVHKGSNGVAIATVPDVCKTPSPGGPVPVPYPNIARSASLKNGSTTVKADGNECGIKDCEFSMSNGDEAGVAGGVVSSTNMKEAKFLLFSFDVKIEGKNACRLTDMMTMNHANTVCLAGVFQVPVIVGTGEAAVACAIWCCDNASYERVSKSRKKPKNNCARLGHYKHACVKQALDKKGDTGVIASPRVPGTSGMSVPAATLEAAGKSYFVPDCVVPTGTGHECIDAKFNCPDDVEFPKGESKSFPSPPGVPGTTMAGPKEDDHYKQIRVNGKKVEDSRAMTPDDANAKKDPDCTCKGVDA